MRWAGTALCTLALSAVVLVGAGSATASSGAVGQDPALSLVAQSPWVTPTQPWFNLALGVGVPGIPISQLHVSVTVYSRIDNFSQFQQAVGATPAKGVLLRLSSVPVATTSGGRTASVCVTVLPDTSASAPAPGPGVGACAAGDPTLYLDCTPATGICGDVYPVSIALVRRGSGTPLQRFTTFLTYQEPAAIGAGGPLRVGVIAPVRGSGAVAMAATLAAHREVPVTLDVSPPTVFSLLTQGGKEDQRALKDLADLTTSSNGGAGSDQLLSRPYVPVDLAAMTRAGLPGEIAIQLARGSQLLRQAGLHPAGDLWIDPTSALTAADAPNLASGLQVVGAQQVILSDSDLAPAGLADSTFAQPFTLALGHTGHLMAAAANSALGARFMAEPDDPALAANQLLGALSFIHFENAFLEDHRGVVVDPPAAWHPRSAFMSTLLAGLTNNPALTPVTLNQLFAQIPAGGNHEPSSRQLQSGAAGTGRIPIGSAQKISLDRQHLTSFTSAVTGHPAVLTTLSDALLATQDSGLSTAQRAAAITTYGHEFENEVASISLATEHTVTFTSRKAPIPITVLSSAPFPVTVVMSLESDKFTFPDGKTRTLVLSRPTTSVRMQAQAISSGDRLPIDVTLRTPDGELVLAHTQLTVHSTSISIVGVVLTALAGLVLLVWWVRTWRRARRHRPRAH
jgi:hypothetical protein